MKAILLWTSFLFWAAGAQALELKGVELPETITLEGQELVLNGAGVRKKFFFDLYLGSLYLEEKTQSAKQIINDDAPMAIRLDIISDKVNRENMTDATLEGFEKATGGNTQPLEAQIAQFMNAFEGKVSKGDRFELLYLPGEGVKAYRNGDLKATIPGLGFKRALFGVWLGEEPAQKSLKRDMLNP